MERSRRAVPFHPVLFAVAPILFVFGYNGVKTPIDPGELLFPLALSLAVTAVLWTILGLLLRSAERAAVGASLFVVLFSSYGHVAEATGLSQQSLPDLFLFWALLMAAGIWLVVRRAKSGARGSPYRRTVLLNCIAAAILAVNLATVVHAYAHRPVRVERGSARTARMTASTDYPDIYYLVTDAYARSDLLKSRFHADNSAFLEKLRCMGFFVAARARSNYVQTHLSIASSLNFTYLDSLARSLGSESDDRGPLINMIQNSRLVDFLRRRGYTIVSFASGYTGTDLAGADAHFAPRWSVSEFQNILLNTTMLRYALVLFRMTPAAIHRDRILYTLRLLSNVGIGRRPAFVWAHVNSPHHPFVFDERGAWPRGPGLPGVDSTKPWLNQVLGTIPFIWYEEYYGSQVNYLNTLLIDVVQRILAASSRPPIIVIHADHGPGSVPDWDRLTREQVLKQPDIFYAVYLPPSRVHTSPQLALYDSITPVNTFRVILPLFFDTTMALLPDRSYFSTFHRPYQLYDTDRPESYPFVDNPPDRK